jgi:hypothetical protein
MSSVLGATSAASLVHVSLYQTVGIYSQELITTYRVNYDSIE